MDVYLHHYPASPFSEKIRLLLGHLHVPWHSVVIPAVMPRPLLMPLSGGYRRTPVLQIGANVYCDSAVIARGLARHAKDATLFAPGFAAHRLAEWADSALFRVMVALNFRPEAIGAMMVGMEPEEIAAFGRDRAELTRGSPMVTISASAARACLDEYLGELEGSLDDAFVFGGVPSIADFSLHHCLWFLRNNAVNAPLLERHSRIGAWMERMDGLGHGRVGESSGEAALAHARESEPVLPDLTASLPDGIELGDAVTIAPTDYGRIPVPGRLAACSVDEAVLARETPETGPLLTHFPRVGFEIAKA